jgi:uroporphyrinogen decarboxylase
MALVTLLPVDLERFWADNEQALQDPFCAANAQAAMSLTTTEGCLWDELGLAEDPAYYHDAVYHVELNRRYNDRAEEVVGRRLLPEFFIPPEEQLPRPLRIEEIFGSEIFRVAGSGTIGEADWVKESIHTIGQLEERIEQVAALDLRAMLFPPGFDDALERLRGQYGLDVQLGGHIRGPVTAAMSLCGVENLIMWLYDYPSTMERFRDLFAAKIVELCLLLRQATGAPLRGFSFADDNCAMLNTRLYERFALPILQHVFSVFSPDDGDRRFQHSDSAMEHLLPLLARCHLTGCNFGPTVRPGAIRRHLPRTIIQGQLPPFTFSRGTPEEIAAAVASDIREVGYDGGLVVDTAGSVNPGSSLAGLRGAMHAIQTLGRYRP